MTLADWFEMGVLPMGEFSACWESDDSPAHTKGAVLLMLQHSHCHVILISNISSVLSCFWFLALVSCYSLVICIYGNYVFLMMVELDQFAGHGAPSILHKNQHQRPRMLTYRSGKSHAKP